MKPAWLSYMKKILWRYPDNYKRENEAVEAALRSGVPELIDLVYVKRKCTYYEALAELSISEQRGEQITNAFLRRIAKNLDLPMGGK